MKLHQLPRTPSSRLVLPLIMYELLTSFATYGPTIHVNIKGLGDRARRGEAIRAEGERSVCSH